MCKASVFEMASGDIHRWVHSRCASYFILLYCMYTGQPEGQVSKCHGATRWPCLRIPCSTISSTARHSNVPNQQGSSSSRRCIMAAEAADSKEPQGLAITGQSLKLTHLEEACALHQALFVVGACRAAQHIQKRVIVEYHKEAEVCSAYNYATVHPPVPNNFYNF